MNCQLRKDAVRSVDERELEHDESFERFKVAFVGLIPRLNLILEHDRRLRTGKVWLVVIRSFVVDVAEEVVVIEVLLDVRLVAEVLRWND